MMKLGAKFSIKDVRDYTAVCSVSNMEFPEEFTLDMIRIKNQGNVGSCVAHALSSIIEYFNKKEFNIKTEMSTGYIYGNRITSSYNGEGMYIRDALAAIKSYGDVPKEYFPYNIEVPEAIEKFDEKIDELYEKGYGYKIASYCKLKTEKDIKQALMTNGPVIMAMEWYSDMRVNSYGLLVSNFNKKDSEGGHCMVIYGWDSRGWKIQNSWGKWWGDKGCAIIPYDTEIREFWTVVDDHIEGMDIVKPYSSNIGKIIAKILNAIWKLISKFTSK